MRRILALCSLFSLGVAVIAIGCSNAAGSADGENGRATPTATPNGDSSNVVSDGGTVFAPLPVSRLCATNLSCLPDDDGTFSPPASIARCATPLDAGIVDGSYGNGCRIVADAGPTCFTDGGADRTGTEGAACSTGYDCAPGYDCIVGTANRGSVCRHYCCAGSSACDDHSSQNGGPTFCDIQSLAVSGAPVPVCMPIKKCRLLEPKDCNADETCAIVSDQGDTGCVAVGPQQVGDACDGAHCAAGLTCLGSAGARSCYQLCRTDDTSSVCGDKKCTTSTIFLDMAYGVCPQQ